MGALPNNSRKEHKDSEDLYVTNHPLAVPGLLSRWRPEKGSIVLEPCCGALHISNALEKFGYVVHSFDLHDWGHGHVRDDYDATEYVYDPYELIVTNPPYNQALPIAQNLLLSLKEKGYMAMLLRLEFQTGIKRCKALEEMPLKHIFPFAFRIECDKGVGVDEDGELELEKSPNSSNYAWFVWEEGYEGDPTVQYIHREDAEKVLAETE